MFCKIIIRKNYFCMQFFPKYESQLHNAMDIMNSGINFTEFGNYYIGAHNLQTSPRIVNSLFAFALLMYTNFDYLALSTDFCWRYALANAADPYMGLSAVLAMYNLGAFGIMNRLKELINSDEVINDPNARERFSPGRNNYRVEILNIVDILTEVSKNFMHGNGTNSQVIDFEITREQLLAMFFGEGGTVAQQGDGGLLLHYYDPAADGDYTAVRQRIWRNLVVAHNFLRGRAPNPTNTGRISPDAISFRYDFLSAIRTVKDDLPFERNLRVAGDAAIIISRAKPAKRTTKTFWTVK